MLTHLYIRNFAIIDTLDLEFQTGMTVLTGETGAGKSILIDAIGLVLGDRADSTMVKHGCEKAEISLTIDVATTPAATKWLAENELDQLDQTECILRRVITHAGKSRAWINGSPVNLGMLKQLGGKLVDIHGQHEHQSLMKKEMQRQLLDDVADNHTLLKSVKKHYENWKTLHQRYETLSQQQDEYHNTIDLLTFQTGELEQLQLNNNEIEQLNEEHSRLANAEQLMHLAGTSYQQLYDDENAIYSLLSTITQNLSAHTHTDTRLKTPLALITSAQIHIQEAAEELRHYVDTLMIDPERLSSIEKRIATIQTLARKHQVNDVDLPYKLQSLQQQVRELTSASYTLETIQEARDKAKSDYLQIARKLSKARKKTAQTLANDVTHAMQTLSMKGGLFTISVQTLDTNNTQHPPTLSPTGIDHIQFNVSANPGQPPQPLVKVASGGELSRISLAIQMITAQKTTLPALIFDEVDTGVGGAIAEIIGQQLRKLGCNQQVLCVTHLPQVAALSHQHYKIVKIKQKQSTSTHIVCLNKKQKISEIARMTGGVDITTSTLALAKEMIDKGDNGEIDNTS
ncbi:MAG TPA: DNA repair protein RecN [Thiothrix sp.]|nr:DNA repair protein RecN [Thiothrix sp.]